MTVHHELHVIICAFFPSLVSSRIGSYCKMYKMENVFTEGRVALCKNNLTVLSNIWKLLKELSDSKPIRSLSYLASMLESSQLSCHFKAKL